MPVVHDAPPDAGQRDVGCHLGQPYALLPLCSAASLWWRMLSRAQELPVRAKPSQRRGLGVCRLPIPASTRDPCADDGSRRDTRIALQMPGDGADIIERPVGVHHGHEVRVAARQVGPVLTETAWPAERRPWRDPRRAACAAVEAA